MSASIADGSVMLPRSIMANSLIASHMVVYDNTAIYNVSTCGRYAHVCVHLYVCVWVRVWALGNTYLGALSMHIYSQIVSAERMSNLHGISPGSTKLILAHCPVQWVVTACS